MGLNKGVRVQHIAVFCESGSGEWAAPRSSGPDIGTWA